METNTEIKLLDIQMIEQPEEIKISLYPHQLASVYQMEKREREQQVVHDNNIIDMNISIQGDKMGYGKTLSLVTLIYRNKMDWDMKKPFCQSHIISLSDGRLRKTNFKYFDKLDVTLILAGNSIINQWYDEFQKSPLCIKKITTKKDIDTILVENYDVILVTPTMYNNLVSKYSGIAWKRFVYDEPGHIKVTSMKKVVAGFIWLVTATPMSIASNYQHSRNSFLYDICGLKDRNFLQYLNYILIKNPDSFVESSFNMPATNHHYHKCYNPLYKTVYGMVNSKIIEMISAGNIQGAIHSLGGKETQNIAELIKNKKENEISELESIIEIVLIRDKHSSRVKYVEELRLKISKLKLQINELNSRYKEILEGDCNICYDKISNPVLEPNCQNVFCGQCILKWLETKNTCPLCRQTVEIKNLIYVKSTNSNDKNIDITGKWEGEYKDDVFIGTLLFKS